MSSTPCPRTATTTRLPATSRFSATSTNVAPATASVEGSKVLNRPRHAGRRRVFLRAGTKPGNAGRHSGRRRGTARQHGRGFRHGGQRHCGALLLRRDHVQAGGHVHLPDARNAACRGNRGERLHLRGHRPTTRTCARWAVTVANNDGTLEATVNYGSGANANRFENVYPRFHRVRRARCAGRAEDA